MLEKPHKQAIPDHNGVKKEVNLQAATQHQHIEKQSGTAVVLMPLMHRLIAVDLTLCGVRIK